MDIETEKFIVEEYKKGLGSVLISRKVGLSKPTILAVIKKHKLTRYKDRCKRLNIKEDNGKFTMSWTCKMCKKEFEKTSSNKSVLCRNHYNSINKNSNCKSCSLILQRGKGNPFYGKKHTKQTLDLISKKISENPPKQSSVSKMEKKLLNEIKNRGINAKGTVSIDKFICDIFIEQYNLIIEFYGDYWHCNPKKYNSEYLHPHKKKTAKEIWEEDKVRIDYLKNLGYNLEIIWEREISDEKKLNKILKKYVKNKSTSNPK
jgi:G:T-mismatch repair DNA endonuclease (very short patch repair protein)